LLDQREALDGPIERLFGRLTNTLNQML
jgi:hypothetical protein